MPARNRSPIVTAERNLRFMLPMTQARKELFNGEKNPNGIKKETFYPVLGQEVNITVSIGLAQLRTKEETKHLFKRVDQAQCTRRKRTVETGFVLTESYTNTENRFELMNRSNRYDLPQILYHMLS